MSEYSTLPAPAPMAVANEILRQLGGGNRVRLMLGVLAFVGSETGLSFRFRVKGADGINAIRIELSPLDTYTVEFLAIRGSSVKIKREFSNVYADQLKKLIEGTTGLALSL